MNLSKKIKDIIHEPNKRNIELLFIFLSLIYASVYLFSHNFNAGDHFFNYLRIKEVGMDLLHLKIPSFNLYTGTILGGAVNTFYPYLLFIPIALISPFIKATLTMFLIVFIGMILGLNITYFTTRTLRKTVHFSILFSLLYCFATTIFAEIYGQGDIGAFYAMLISPLVFVGWYQWIINNKWKMLTIGIILEIYTHIATTICLLLILPILTLLFIKHISWQNIWSLIKAILFTIGITIFYWFPMLYLLLTNKLYIPSQVVLNSSQQNLIFHPLLYYFAPQLCNIWGILDAIALFLILKYWQILKLFYHKIILIILVIYIINIHPIEKYLISYTWLYHLQFLHRFAFIAHYFLMLIFTEILINIIYKRIRHQNWIRIIKLLLIWIFFILLWGVFLQIFVNYHANTKIYNPYVYSSYPKEKYQKMITPNTSIYNNQSFSVKSNHDLPYNYPDYYPKNLSKIKRGVEVFTVFPHFNEYTNSNIIKYYSKDNSYHRIPLTIYNMQKYNIKDNNKQVRIRDKKHMVYIKMDNGKNNIRINNCLPKYIFLSLFLSILLSIVFLL